MAALTPVRFGQQSIQFGNGASPTEVFTEKCGVIGITENFPVNTQSDDLADCDNDDAVSFDSPYKTSYGKSLDLQIQATASNKPFFEALVSDETETNIRHVFNSAGYAGYNAGPVILTALAWQSERRGILTGTCTLSYTSDPVWNPT